MSGYERARPPRLANGLNAQRVRSPAGWPTEKLNPHVYERAGCPELLQTRSTPTTGSLPCCRGVLPKLRSANPLIYERGCLTDKGKTLV